MFEHTPEPWHVATNPGSPEDQPAFPSVRDSSGLEHGQDIICMPLGDSKTVKANANRIVACVNACQGLNPEAVPDLLAACKAVIRNFDNPNVGWSACRPIVEAAIAKAEGGTQ